MCLLADREPNILSVKTEVLSKHETQCDLFTKHSFPTDIWTTCDSLPTLTTHAGAHRWPTASWTSWRGMERGPTARRSQRRTRPSVWLRWWWSWKSWRSQRIHQRRRTGPVEAAELAGMGGAPVAQESWRVPGMKQELWLGSGQGQELWLCPAGMERRQWGVEEQVDQSSEGLSCSHWAGWTWSCCQKDGGAGSSWFRFKGRFLSWL